MSDVKRTNLNPSNYRERSRIHVQIQRWRRHGSLAEHDVNLSAVMRLVVEEVATATGAASA
jgi:hypothetical protein